MMSLNPFDLQTMRWGDDYELEDAEFFSSRKIQTLEMEKTLHIQHGS